MLFIEKKIWYNISYEKYLLSFFLTFKKFETLDNKRQLIDQSRKWVKAYLIISKKWRNTNYNRISIVLSLIKGEKRVKLDF
jgi:hypothetical protein